VDFEKRLSFHFKRNESVKRLFILRFLQGEKASTGTMALGNYVDLLRVLVFDLPGIVSNQSGGMSNPTYYGSSNRPKGVAS
jgi:hypothetical protein